MHDSKCQHCGHGNTQSSVPFCARHRVFSADVRSPRREDYDTHYLQVCNCIDKSLQPQLESQACMERPDKHSNEDSQFVVLAEAYRSQSNYSLILFFDDPTKMYLQLVLATLVNGALPFVQATYKLEGDHALTFERYDIISSLTAAVHVADYPNVKAVCKKPTREIHLCNSSCCCTLSSVCSHYNHHLSWCLKKPLAAFKAARLIVPQKMQEVQPDSSTIDSLAVFMKPQATLNALKSKLPQYIACSEDMTPDCDLLPWWKVKQSDLPTCAASFKKVLCIQPSSDAVERVFSL